MPPSRRILVHGHRGARAVLPENTLPSFEYAIGIGVDAIELDVNVTKDHVAVVVHDPQLGDVPIHGLLLSEVRRWDCGETPHPDFPKQRPVPGARIPTLDEVLALRTRGDFLFNVEAKLFPDHLEWAPPPAEFASLVLAEFRRHAVERRVIFQSFDFRVLHEMKRLAPEIRLAALWEGEDRNFASIAREAGTAVVAPEYTQVNPEKVRAAHVAGLEVVPWTANTPADWSRLIAAEVDAIITDDPAELIGYLKKGREEPA